ncbi:MAG TPA: NADP-dependent oxidoreductase [Hyphomicrobiaceae bacterium]|nr:NADP-dependent oxidoreductase [Hyphomicrobiaceae bacterium]
MKAVYIERHGGPEELKYGNLPDPVARAGEVVVDVHAASVNGADWKVRTGESYAQTQFPYVLGRDFSGVVSAVGDGVGDLAVGDEVFAVCDVGQEGAYAEKIAIKSAIVARKPASLSHQQAAAVALAGLTALVSVEDTLQLRRGETILVQGGAGGVASIAVQLAKHLGARVITTASAANHAYLREIGADVILDYRGEDFTRAASGCDAVFDTVGGEAAKRSFAVLKPGGRAAFIASGAQAPRPPRSDVQSLRPNVLRDRPHLDRIAALVAAKAIKVPEITAFPLAQAEAAHRISQSRHLRGKLVLKVR